MENICGSEVLRKLDIIFRIKLSVEVKRQVINILYLVPEIGFKKISLHKNKHQKRIAPTLQKNLFESLEDFLSLDIAEFVFNGCCA
jgi:hypothetical protein